MHVAIRVFIQALLLLLIPYHVLGSPFEYKGTSKHDGIASEHLPEHDTTDWSPHNKFKRDVRTTCSMDGYLCQLGQGQSTGKRNVDSRDDFNNTIPWGLSPRTMIVPSTRTRGEGMFSIFDKELVDGKFTPVVWNEARKNAKKITDICTAVFKPIGGNTAQSLGVRGLCGCTVLIVASRTGVYMTHYWESMVFSPSEDWLEGTTADDLYNDNVITGITNGIPKPATAPTNLPDRQASLTANAATILAGAGPDNDKVKGYLIRPATAPTPDEDPGYQAKWLRLKQTVGQIIPNLAIADGDDTNQFWTDITYDPLDNEDQRLRSTAHGKVIFKYDPSHEGQKKVALWVENYITDRHNDQWT